MNNNGINVLSLFSGSEISKDIMKDMGVSINNWYSSEVDPYAIAVSKYHYKDLTHLGDIRNIDTDKLEGIDLLIGGSSCQNFSLAGNRIGMSTKENIEVLTLEKYLELKKEGMEFEGLSYLFWEYIKIKNETNPKYFLLENVVMSKKWEKIITDAMGVEPILINSKLVSAQKRPRLYWTNIPNITQPIDKGLTIKDILDEEYSKKEILSDKIQDRFIITGEDEISGYSIGTTKPPFRTIGQRDHVFGDNQKMGCLVATDYKQPKQIFHNGILRKISPIEAERLQTLKDDYTKWGLFEDGVKQISNTQRLKIIGNGWTRDIIEHIFSFINWNNI